jgi:hypothetical protein
VEAQRIEDTDEHEASGWTAFEEGQEPSDAMTIIGAAPREEDVVPEPEPVAAAEPEPEVEPGPEPDEEPEPELPPAAEVEEAPAPDGGRRWWRRHKSADDSVPEPEPPRHVRVLPADDEPDLTDPWEQGFDEPAAAQADEIGEPDEETEEPVLLEEPARRRFRRR